jgi:hypothetical protein
MLLAAGFAALSFCASGASASTRYAVDYPAAATLYTVDTGSGAATAVGPVGIDNIGDLTSDQVSTLWGIQITTNSLVTIDPATGLGTLGPAITGTGGPAGAAPFPIVSLAYDTANSTLYGDTSVPYGGETADELYSINTTTGAATDVGTIGDNSVYALGFDQSGDLFGVDGNCNLLGISTTTGAGTIIGATGTAPNGGCGAYDIASDPSSGLMYLADSNSSSLFSVDLTTGAATLVGPYGGSPNLVGLAFLGTATPEPGTLALFAAGLGLVAVGKRKKKNADQ